MSDFKSWEELTDLEQAACEYSDFFKDAYGFRPTHINTTGWTMQDFDREFEILSKVCCENATQRVAEESVAAHDFEIRVQSLLQSGAKDRTMAIRWIDEAEESNGDMSYLCFLLGLPYDYIPRNTSISA